MKRLRRHYANLWRYKRHALVRAHYKSGYQILADILTKTNKMVKAHYKSGYQGL